MRLTIGSLQSVAALGMGALRRMARLADLGVLLRIGRRRFSDISAKENIGRIPLFPCRALRPTRRRGLA